MSDTISLPPVLAGWWNAYPHQRAWTLRDRSGSWGAFAPRTGEIRDVSPAEDAELPGLRTALHRGQLLGYRVGRRAVVATKDSYLKVLRPKRSQRVTSIHEWITDAQPTLIFPRILGADEGVIELAEVSGRSLHQQMRHSTRDLATTVEHVSRGIAALHRTPAPTSLPVRKLDDPESWLNTVAIVEPHAAAALRCALQALPTLQAVPTVVVHGDLHDKNVMISGESVGLIDLDGVGLGTPEDDIANLAVHLELRGLQAGCPLVGRALSDRLVSTYERERPLDAMRLDAVKRHTWFRLACIYHFRTASRPLVPTLLGRAIER